MCHVTVYVGLLYVIVVYCGVSGKCVKKKIMYRLKTTSKNEEVKNKKNVLQEKFIGRSITPPLLNVKKRKTA